MLKPLIYLLLPSLLLTSLNSKKGPAKSGSDDLAAKAQAFTDKLTDYEFSDESVSYLGMFDRMVMADWAGTITLKSKKVYRDEKNKPMKKRLFFSFYLYSDSSKIAFCLDSLVKCFPPDCNKIEKFKDVAQPSAFPSVYIFNKNTIETLHINCPEIPDNWEAMKKDFINTFAEKHSVVLSCDCGGKVKWNRK